MITSVSFFQDNCETFAVYKMLSSVLALFLKPPPTSFLATTKCNAKLAARHDSKCAQEAFPRGFGALDESSFGGFAKESRLAEVHFLVQTDFPVSQAIKLEETFRAWKMQGS